MNKFEQLIEFVINDEQDKAKELFHEIVVEKSRDIYENIMAEEESLDEEVVEEEDAVEEGIEEELGGSETLDLIDDIETEEEGISFEDDDMDMTNDEEVIAGEEDEANDEELEDRVVDLEDKLDELMAEFEELMGAVDTDGDGDHDMDDHEAEEGNAEEDEMEVEYETEGLEEAVSLEAAPKPVTSEEGDGKSGPVAANSGAKGMDAKPVSTDTTDEKGRAAPTANDQGGTTKPDLKAAPKPVTAQAGGVNTKSPY